jgi:hypothetical protein
VYGQIAKEELKLPYSIYDQQKRYVRKQVRQMYEEDIDVYLKLLDKVQKTLDADILEHSNDYKSYLNTAYRVYDRVKDIFVDEILVENHMEEKSRQTGEWDKYIRGVIKNIKSGDEYHAFHVLFDRANNHQGRVDERDGKQFHCHS